MLTVQHLSKNHFDRQRMIESYSSGISDAPPSPSEEILKRSQLTPPVSHTYGSLFLNCFPQKALIEGNTEHVATHYNPTSLLYPVLGPIDTPFMFPLEHMYIPGVQSALLRHNLLTQSQNTIFQTQSYLLGNNLQQFHHPIISDTNAVRVHAIQHTQNNSKIAKTEDTAESNQMPVREEQINQTSNEKALDYRVPKVQKINKRKLSGESETSCESPAKRQQLSFTCNICSSSYKHRFELNRHIKVSHVRPHKCTECDKGFGHKNYLRIHIETVHKGLKTHKCEFCGKHLSTGGNLSVHIKTIHMGEKKYQCTICNRSFGQQCNMKTHMKRHEKNGDNIDES